MAISYHLTGNTTDGTTNSSYAGSLERTITDEDQKKLGLTEDVLIKALKEIRDYSPGSAYLHAPAPAQYLKGIGDMYKAYGWPQATVSLKPISAKIHASDNQLQQVAVEHLKNDSSVPGTFHAQGTANLSNSISNSWSNTNTVSFSETIEVKLTILGTGVQSNTTIGYNHAWGETKTETFEYGFGVSTGVDVRLDPGQAVDVLIYANVGQYTAEITYDVDIAGGDCAYSWPEDDWHGGHHNWSIDAKYVAYKAASLPQTIVETVKFGFASDGTCKLTDPKNGNVLAESDISSTPGGNKPLLFDLRSN
jgi:hypothetical protein